MKTFPAENLTRDLPSKKQSHSDSDVILVSIIVWDSEIIRNRLMWC